MSSSYLKALESQDGTLEIEDAAAKLPPADLKALAALISAPKHEREVRFQSRAAALKLVPLVADKQLPALIRRLSVLPYTALRALSDAQLRVADAWALAAHREFRAGAPYVDHKSPDIACELMRRGLFTASDLTARLSMVAVGEAYELWREFVSAARELTTVGAPTLPEWVQGRYDAHAHLATFSAQLRPWFVGLRAAITPAKLGDADVMFLIAVTWEPADAAWLADLFAKGTWTDTRTREDATRQLASALIGHPDGAAILATLRKGAKGKRLADIFDTAAAQLVALLAHVNVSAGAKRGAAPAPVALDWSRIDTDEAVTLVRGATDPAAMLAAGAATTDPVALLNVWRAIYRITYGDFVDAKTKTKKPLAIPVTLIEQLIGALAEHYTDAAPDTKALSARIAKAGYLQAARVFTDGLDLLLSTRRTQEAEAAAITAAVTSAFTATKNRRFRGWVESRVADWQPALSESVAAKLARLAGETRPTKAAGKTVSRSIVVRADDDAPPARADINRLYGAPIGVTAATWPTFGKAKMAHVITLETRLLSAAARRALGKDCAAVAVFLSTLTDHQAFAPSTPHAAVVRLTAAQVSKPAAPGDDAIGLVAAAADVPDKVFLGGKKAGAIAELRTLFDRDDLLQPDRESPRWLQSPQPSGGAFLFELDHAFAGRANMGDGGRLYVFADTAFVQST